jgi:hypothetical protein
MAAKPRKKKLDWKPYPKHDGLDVGCKVSWYYYKNQEDAIAAARAAEHNAMIQSYLGYDFGYCSPGSIEPAFKDSEFAGMYRVCIP